MIRWTSLLFCDGIVTVVRYTVNTVPLLDSRVAIHGVHGEAKASDGAL